MSYLACLSLLVCAAGEPRVYTLNPGVDVWDVTTHDFNGDGLKDILVLSCDSKSTPFRKFCDVFVANLSGGYSERPTVRLPLEPEIGAVFLAEVNGSAPKELVATSAEGAQVYEYRDGAFLQISAPRFMSLYPSGAREPSILKNGAIDLDGDGIDEWIVPMPTGYEIRNVDEIVQRVECDVNSDIRMGSGMYISNRLPAFRAFDLPGQDHKALAFLSDEFADFAYGTDWLETRRFKIPITLGEKWDSSSEMVDINNDGIPDLVVTETRGTINLRSQTQVYIASAPMEYPSKPTSQFNSKGTFTAPLLHDIDGNGELDLLFLNVPFGLRFFANLFMMGKLGIEIEVYLSKDGRFAATPDLKTDVSIEAPDGKEAAAHAVGDFNGDGRMDIAFGMARDKLVIRTGTPDKLVSPKVWKTISVPSFGTARTFKHENGTAENLIIFHPGISNSTKLEVVTF